MEDVKETALVSLRNFKLILESNCQFGFLMEHKIMNSYWSHSRIYFCAGSAGISGISRSRVSSAPELLIGLKLELMQPSAFPSPKGLISFFISYSLSLFQVLLTDLSQEELPEDRGTFSFGLSF